MLLQNVAHIVWVSAMMNYQDENPFAALAIAAERRLSDYNPSLIQMALWAFSRRECVLVS